MRAFLFAPALLACACAAPRAPSGAPSPSASRVRTPAPAPSFTSSTPALPDDSLWQRASHGDAIDLARLAEREGAAGLLAALDGGGAPGRAALLALPYAPDAQLAAGRLCQLSTRVDASSRSLVLIALHGVLSRPPPGERLDAAGLARCRIELTHLEQRVDLSGSDRDRTEAARALLAEQLGASFPGAR